MSIIHWLILPEIWVILGIILVILEVTLDGSKIIFLPLGLAALLNAGVIYIQGKTGIVAVIMPLDRWETTLITFGFLSVIFAIALRTLARYRRTDPTPDVNDY